jgi:hypothetical protein
MHLSERVSAEQCGMLTCCTVLQDLLNAVVRLLALRISFLSRDEGFVVGGSRLGMCLDHVVLWPFLFEAQSCRRCVVFQRRRLQLLLERSSGVVVKCE